MRLSICIPVFNRSRVQCELPDEKGEMHARTLEPLPRTVESICRSLGRLPELACTVEIVVADYGSTDWPPADWLPAAAWPVPARVIPLDGAFSIGEGKNAAAEAAKADRLLFWETDLFCPTSLIVRGLELTDQGKAYFPRYQREKSPGGELYWGSGHGCCMVRREHWERNRWLVGYGWVGADEDTRFAAWFSGRGLLVREDEPDMIHMWHPLDPTKVAAGVNDG